MPARQQKKQAHSHTDIHEPSDHNVPSSLFQSFDPGFQLIFRYAAFESVSLEPVAASGVICKVLSASADAAASRCTER